jgi:hypothetical protein
MDEDGSGEITVSDLRRKYNVKMHADFISGAKSEDELLAEYLMKFEGGDGRKDGRVTLLEFEAYYDKVSFAAGRLSDEHFQELMMRAWNIDPAAQSQPKFSRANLRRRALDVALHPQAASLVEEARRLSKSGGFVVADSSDLLRGLGLLDQALLLPNGAVACIRLQALDFFMCPDIFTDNIVLRRACQTLLALLHDKYPPPPPPPPRRTMTFCNTSRGTPRQRPSPPPPKPSCTRLWRRPACAPTLQRGRRQAGAWCAPAAITMRL